MQNPELIQSLIVIGGFLVAVFMLSFFLKRIVISKKIQQLGLDFKIVTKLPLSNKSFLYIVQIGNHYLLVGASDNHISAIADLTKAFNSLNSRLVKSSNNPHHNEISSGLSTTDFSFRNFLKETFRKSKN